MSSSGIASADPQDCIDEGLVRPHFVLVFRPIVWKLFDNVSCESYRVLDVVRAWSKVFASREIDQVAELQQLHQQSRRILSTREWHVYNVNAIGCQFREFAK